MAHYLNLNQLAEEASRLGADEIVTMLEECAQAAAMAIEDKRGDVVVTDPASMQDGFGGLCVGFGPVKKRQKCPDDFKDYDPGSTWAEGEAE